MRRKGIKKQQKKGIELGSHVPELKTIEKRKQKETAKAESIRTTIF